MEQMACTSVWQFWKCNDATVFWSALTAIGTIGATIIALSCSVLVPMIQKFYKWRQAKTKFRLCCSEFRDAGDDDIAYPHISMAIQSKYDVLLELNSAKIILRLKTSALPLVFDLQPVKKVFLLPMDETTCDFAIINRKNNNSIIQSDAELAEYINKDKRFQNKVSWVDKIAKVELILNAENGRNNVPAPYWAISDTVDGIQGSLCAKDFMNINTDISGEPTIESVKQQIQDFKDKINIVVPMKKKQRRKELRQIRRMKIQEKLDFLHIFNVKVLKFKLRLFFSKIRR